MGGTAGAQQRQGRNQRIREVDTNVYELTLRTGGGVAVAAAGMWNVLPMKIVAIEREPAVVLAPGGLRQELLLLDKEEEERQCQKPTTQKTARRKACKRA